MVRLPCFCAWRRRIAIRVSRSFIALLHLGAKPFPRRHDSAPRPPYPGRIGCARIDAGRGDALRLANDDWSAASDWVVEAERLGVDCVWSAEAWGHDAVTPLAFLAARTFDGHIRLAGGNRER